MSKLIKGDYKCPKDGVFHWKGFYLTTGINDYINIDWDKDTDNFIHADNYNDKIRVQLECPKCKKKYIDYIIK